MKSKIVLVVILVTLFTGIAVGFSVSIVYAEGETETNEAPVTFGWIIAAWLIYSFVGFFASGENFDGLKFARTFIVTLVVAFIALVFQIPPANVVTQYGVIIDQVATVVLNTAQGISLIYLSEKFMKILAATKAKWEKARELAQTGLGPPSLEAPK